MAGRTWIGGDTGNETKFTPAANYAEAAKPISDDDLYFPSTNLYALALELGQSAILLNSLTVEQGSPINIGTLSTSGVPTYFEISCGGAATNKFNYSGIGSCYFDIDDAGEIKIQSASSGSTFGYGLVFTGTDNDAVNIVRTNIQPGVNKIGFAPFGGGIFETDAMNISAYDVYMGAGCTKKDGSSAIPIIMSGGNAFTECPLAATTLVGGILTVRQGAVAGLTVSDASVLYEGRGTLTALTLGSKGVFDARVGSGSASLAGTVEMSAGSAFYDPEGRFGDVAIHLNGCTLGQVTIQTPLDKTITLS